MKPSATISHLEQSRTKAAGLTLVEVLIALIVLAVVIAATIMLYHQRARAELQAQADDDPKSVFLFKASPTTTKVTAGDPARLICTIENPSRYDLYYWFDDSTKFRIDPANLPGGVELAIDSDWYVDWQEDSNTEANMGSDGDVAVFGLGMLIPARESLDIIVTATIGKPGGYQGYVLLVEETIAGAYPPGSGPTTTLRSSELISNEIEIVVTAPELKE